MNKILNPIILFSALLLTSCAFHSGMMTGNASLNENNFTTKTIGTGTAKTTQVFGIGGLKQRALIYEAKKDLYRAYPLSEDQAYANVTVDFKRSFYFIVSTTIATVTADVIQFNDSNKEDPDNNMGRLIKDPIYSDSTRTPAFHPDQIAALFKKQELVKVRILENMPGKPGKYLIEYIHPEDGNIKVVKENNLFLYGDNDRISRHDFRVGDPVYFQYSHPDSKPIGIVYAIGAETLILKSGDKIFAYATRSLKKMK